MAEVTASMIKELRDKTLAGMLDCKKALIECDGDMQAAADYLRKKGLAAANKRSGREIKEGTVLIRLSDDNRKATLLEMNCETDFVARNDEFRKLSEQVLEGIEKAPASVKTAEELPAAIQDEVKNAIATTGENMAIGRFEKLEIPAGTNGVIANYIHSNSKIGVVVELHSSAPADKLLELGKELCMQGAAANPQWVIPAEVPADIVTKEKEIYTEQMASSGKPANVIEKIVEGKLAKFYSDVCLLEQEYIKDSSKKVKDLVKEIAGADVTVARFVRIQIGA